MYIYNTLFQVEVSCMFTQYNDIEGYTHANFSSAIYDSTTTTDSTFYDVTYVYVALNLDRLCLE